MYKCIKCGKEYKNLKLFPASQSKLYGGWDGHLPICRECLYNMFEELKDSYGDERLALRRLCMLFDIHYSEEIFDSATKRNNSSFFGTYLRNANLKQHMGKTYEDNYIQDVVCPKVNSEDDLVKINEDINDIDNEIKKETISRFGNGLTVEQYTFLQREFEEWTSLYECQSKSQEELFAVLCMNKLEIIELKKTGKKTKDAEENYRKTMQSLGILPNQNNLEDLANAKTFGTLIKDWEDEDPIPEVDEKYKDVDKLGLYIDVFFKGHLAKMLNIVNGLSDLYTRFMKKYTVYKPEYEDDENSEALFDAIFGKEIEDE